MENSSIRFKKTFSKIKLSFMMKGYPVYGTSAELYEIEFFKVS